MAKLRLGPGGTARPFRLTALVLAGVTAASPLLAEAQSSDGTLGSSDQGVRAGALSPQSLRAVPPASPSPASPPADVPAPVPSPSLSPSLAFSPDALKLSTPKLTYRRRYNLLISGTGVLIATWAADRLLGRDLSESPASWVPLIGPWWLLAEQRQLAAPSSVTSFLLVVDGLLQAGGLTLGILGVTLFKKRMVVALPPVPASVPLDAPPPMPAVAPSPGPPPPPAAVNPAAPDSVPSLPPPPTVP